MDWFSFRLSCWLALWLRSQRLRQLQRLNDYLFFGHPYFHCNSLNFPPSRSEALFPSSLGSGYFPHFPLRVESPKAVNKRPLKVFRSEAFSHFPVLSHSSFLSLSLLGDCFYEARIRTARRVLCETRHMVYALTFGRRCKALSGRAQRAKPPSPETYDVKE